MVMMKDGKRWRTPEHYTGPAGRNPGGGGVETIEKSKVTRTSGNPQNSESEIRGPFCRRHHGAGYQLWKTSWEKVALEILHVALVTASQIEAKVVASKLSWWYMLIKRASPQRGRVLPRCQRSSSGEMRCKQIHDFCLTFRDVQLMYKFSITASCLRPEKKVLKS